MVDITGTLQEELEANKRKTEMKMRSSLANIQFHESQKQSLQGRVDYAENQLVFIKTLRNVFVGTLVSYSDAFLLIKISRLAFDEVTTMTNHPFSLHLKS